MEGEGDGEMPVAAVRFAAETIGFPVFIRTDLASAKHDGPEAYRADRLGDIAQVLARTVGDNEIKFWLHGPGPVAFLVRQWLNLESTFSAFWGKGHRIAKEYRVFSDGQRALCRHFYWPEEAIDGHNPSVPDWRTCLERLAVLSDGEVALLEDLACRAAHAAGDGSWSVDFAKDETGKWWLIDMAVAEESWHPACVAGKPA